MAAAPTGRGQWSGQLGFVLAAAGSAVGLGNIWRFPYMAAEGGGGVFVFIYLVCVLAIGVPVLFAELAIAEAGDRVVFVKPLLRAGGGFDVPFDDRQAQGPRHLARQFRLAGARRPGNQPVPICHAGVEYDLLATVAAEQNGVVGHQGFPGVLRCAQITAWPRR